MAKQRQSCAEQEDDDEPLIIHISQAQRGRSCDCHTEGNAAAPFPFKGEDTTTFPLSIEQRPTITSDGSESTLSVVSINPSPAKTPPELPLLSPREHGHLCTLEVSVLEKHAEGCSYKKREKEGRHPMDDKVGSYDVVNRMVYRTCTGNGNMDDHGDVIKSSAKSFRLNDPTFFGKDLKEKRSRIETLPILPNYDQCMMRVENLTPVNQFKTITAMDEPARPVVIQNVNDNLEVLSVYIRRDKNEKVPDGFQKMHYRGDSCKLHDPNQRNKQILALQNVIKETSSGAQLAKSNRRFSPLLDKETRVMPAVESPVKLPKSLYAPKINIDDSEDSLESYTTTPQVTNLDRNRDQERDQDIDSLELLPQRRSVSPPLVEDSKTGLFGCFKRGRPKKQSNDSYIEEKNFNSRKVTHSDSQPKRHSSPAPTNPRKLSAQYGNRKHL